MLDGQASWHRTVNSGFGTLDVTATAADGRQVEDDSSVSLTITPAAPSVILDPPPVPDGGFAQHPDSEYTVSAEAFSPDPASLTYEWTLEGTTVLSTGSSSVTVTGAEYDDVWLTVGSSGGATTVTLCDPTQTIGVVEGLPAAPTLTITESDANQMVFEGDVATFDVHATWAAWTMSPLGTASQGWWVSSALPNVDYSTMDASGAAPADYVSTRGPRPVPFGNVTYDSATGMYSADGTITVNTVGGIDDGVDGGVTVQLTHPFMCQIAGDGGGQATATIVHPDVTIRSPSETAGTIDVIGDDGGRVEVDVSALVDSSFAAEGGLALQVALPQGYSSDLSFWDASTGGNQLTPQGADNVLETWSTPTGGVYSGTIWVEDDALAEPENGSSYVILAQVVPVVGAAPAVQTSAPAQATANWSIGQPWQYDKNYDPTGTAVAGTGGANLMQLADDITGNGNDFTQLVPQLRDAGINVDPYTGNVPAGTVVPVASLLATLESRIRANVVEVANMAKNATFGLYTNWPGPPGWTESYIDGIFGIRGATALAKANWPAVDCGMMAALTMSAGVILTLQPGEFQAMALGYPDFRPGLIQAYFLEYSPPKPRSALQPGDWVVFWNNPNYPPRGAWAKENTIMVGADLYWGWSSTPGGNQGNYASWKTFLANKFAPGSLPNLVRGYDDKVPAAPGGAATGGTPPGGYSEVFNVNTGQPVTAGFINVPKLAAAIFSYRTGIPRTGKGFGGW